MKPLVTVIIPTCNRPWLLEKAVRSVLNQNYDAIEIIVVNDGIRPLSSTISSLNKKIRVIENSPNSMEQLGYPSGGYSRNAGVSVSSGEYIAFLDDDDQFEENKIHKQIAELERDTSIAAICTDAYISIFPWINPLYRRRFNSFYRKELSVTLKKNNMKEIPEKIDSNLLEQHNFIITSSVIVKRDVFNKVGMFKNIKTYGQLINGKIEFEDWEFWRRVATVSPFKYLNEPLVHYKRGSLKKLAKKLGLKTN